MSATTDLLQARFRELCAERDAILAKSAGLKAQREQLLSQIETLTVQQKGLTAQIRSIEDPVLTKVMADMSALVKALNGKTGPQAL